MLGDRKKTMETFVVPGARGPFEEGKGREGESFSCRDFPLPRCARRKYFVSYSEYAASTHLQLIFLKNVNRAISDETSVHG